MDITNNIGVRTVLYKSYCMYVMVQHHCQLDWIYDDMGDTPLGVFEGTFNDI